MHPEENGAVADRFRKAKMLDHDAICEANFLTISKNRRVWDRAPRFSWTLTTKFIFCFF